MRTWLLNKLASTALSSTMVARRGPGLLVLGAACLVSATANAQALPSGGSVAQGQATISTGSNAMTVNQTSSRAVINWNSFSVGADNTVTFNQRGPQGATLNRVTGATTSQIAGRIDSNGAVYLVNPNGIAITSSGVVNTAGGFVASTLDIADGDFMAGNMRFTGQGSSAKVSNAGHITAGQGAYVALLGGSVANSGYVTVPLGRVGLGSGEDIALDINGGGFMQVAAPTSALTGGAALIDQSGSIVAAGGLVQLKAATLRDVVRNVINMSGSINADSAVANGGTIQLLAGDGGTLTATGTLSARASGLAGDGGMVEMAGADIDYTGLTVDTYSYTGRFGTWLLDSPQFTIEAAGADTIAANLATSNVTLVADAGDITINAPIGAWENQNALTLSAYRDVNINAEVHVGYATVRADNSATSIGTLRFGGGGSLQGSGSYGPNGFYNTLIYYNPQSYSAPTDFSAHVSSSYVAYMLIHDAEDLQNMNQNLGGNYALARDIDASATASWNGGAGFVPIGTDGAGNIVNGEGFTGRLDGGAHTINGLTINRPDADYVGLIGAGGLTSGGRGSQLDDFRDLNLVDVSIVGRSYVGGLFGYAGTMHNAAINFYNIQVAGSVSGVASGGDYTGFVGGVIGYLDSYYSIVDRMSSSGTVTGYNFVGGLIGVMSSSEISNSYSTSDVTGNTGVGGLMGQSSAFGSNLYATGDVTGIVEVGGLFGSYGGLLYSAYSSGTVSVAAGANGIFVGGLFGRANNYDSQDVYSTSNVNAPDSQYVGGIVGYDYQHTITNSYYAGTIYAPGSQYVGALAGAMDGYFSTFYSSYWDRSIIGGYATQNYGYVSDINGNFINADGGLTTAQLQDFDSYSTTYEGWAFEDTFDGYSWNVGVWAPPTLAGQAGQSENHYPELYALTPVVFVDPTDTSRTYGAANPTFSITIKGGNPATAWETGYRLGPIGDVLSTQALVSSALNPALSVGQYAIIDSNLATSAAGVTYRVIRAEPGTLTVTPAELTVTYVADPTSRPYGSANQTVTGSLNTSGLVNGDTLDEVTSGDALFNTTATSHSNVGAYAITGSGVSGASGNYNFTFVQAEGNATALSITPVSILVTALGGSSTYGANPSNPGFTATGLVNGEDVSVLTGLSNSFGISNTTDAGTYATSVVGDLTNGNYVINNRIAGSWIVNPASIVVTALGGTSTYGSNPANPGLSATGLVNGEDVSVLTGLSNSFGLTNTTNAGTYATNVAGDLTNGNYVISDRVSGNWIVNPASIVVTALGGSSTYGSNPTNPGLSATGLVNGEDVSVLTGLSNSFGVTSTVDAGAYDTGVIGVLGNGNYVISSRVSGTWTVNPASLVLTYTAANANSVYGSALAGLSGTVGATGLVNGETLAEVTTGTVGWSTDATASSDAGAYAVTGSGLGAANGNYVLTVQQAGGNAEAYTITPALLVATYTANPLSSLYGETVTGLNGDVSVEGLVNGDEMADALSGAATWTTDASATSNVGSYAVTGDGLAAAGGNYSITFQQAAGNATALSITPRSLTVTADAQERFYGLANPALTYSAASGAGVGLVNGDTLTGALATAATTDSPVGAYAITQGSLAASANYTLTYVGAELTVKALPIQSINSFIPAPNADSVLWFGALPPDEAGSGEGCPPADVSSEYRNEGAATLGSGGSCAG